MGRLFSVSPRDTQSFLGGEMHCVRVFLGSCSMDSFTATQGVYERNNWHKTQKTKGNPEKINLKFSFSSSFHQHLRQLPFFSHSWLPFLVLPCKNNSVLGLSFLTSPVCSSLWQVETSWLFPHLIGQCNMVSPENIHTNNIIQIEQVIVRNKHVCTYMQVITTNEKREH